ncbi:hypothetical protein PSTT_09413 [Puccinia striiformis]|uniref:Uncharacterized protein n=2 Tax=Puccinia striiformis TaxID=27350 RepID=A0A0L0UP92_9BASI|nr:hypothetical protein PSTG_17642 [Puccinia striiformis f. sp. tritici PST-78]POW05875.1 hypothetical protein PSTT_09413 [Puccinia striiformis]
MASHPRQAGRSSQIDLDQVVREGEEYGVWVVPTHGPVTTISEELVLLHSMRKVIIQTVQGPTESNLLK